MTPIPRDGRGDGSIAFLREGYTFIPTRCARHRSDLFRTRLMLREVVCMTGEEAATEFYQPGRFTRRGALPPTTVLLLQDFPSVQLRDGEDHHHRKGLFLSLLRPPEANARLADLMAERWTDRLGAWERAGSVTLHPEVRAILCEAACSWAGVPLSGADAEQRTREFGAMIDGAGSVGPRNWAGQVLRSRTERWAKSIVEQVRAGRLEVAPESPVAQVAAHRNRDGELLPLGTAAVELINLLRPTVAVARFITFAALALHAYPECRERLRTGDVAYRERFAQEVRRFYPFFPAVGGRVLTPFDWRGHHFAEGDWVLLDVYGTNHDPRTWDRPNEFRPDRFRDWSGSAYSFIPQGGGDHAATHRCPGEWATVDLVARAAELLTTGMRYDIPPQDTRISLRKMPALPESGFVIENVRRVA